MFEVIWSWSADAYVVRPASAFSHIKPKFIGSREECVAWADKHN